MAWKHRDPWTRAPHSLALEPRIMFDAAGAATYSDATDSETPAHGSEPASLQIGSEIVFIDTSVANYEALADAWRATAEVVIINGDTDALAQMAAHLSTRNGIDAIHIVTHGRMGALAFGSGVVDATNLENHAATLAAIGASLTETGDVLLYGCFVGVDSAGAAFIAALSSL